MNQLCGRGALRAVMIVAALTGFAPAAAQADFGVASFDAGVCNHDVEPNDQCTRDTSAYWYRQAAGHPDFGITDFKFNTSGLLQTPDDNVKDVRVDLPVGLSVNPE